MAAGGVVMRSMKDECCGADRSGMETTTITIISTARRNRKRAGIFPPTKPYDQRKATAKTACSPKQCHSLHSGNKTIEERENRVNDNENSVNLKK
jgi:hypothetical protein